MMELSVPHSDTLNWEHVLPNSRAPCKAHGEFFLSHCKQGSGTVRTLADTIHLLLGRKRLDLTTQACCWAIDGFKSEWHLGDDISSQPCRDPT